MPTLATLQTDLDALPLGQLLEVVPTTIELERIVPIHSHIIPYFWTRNVSAVTVERILGDSDEFSVESVESVGDETLFRVEWKPRGLGSVVQVFAEGPIELLGATGTSDGWWFDVRGHDHESIAQFVEDLKDVGVTVQLRSIQKMARVEPSEFGATKRQREALALAYERGYFDSPRHNSLESIAEEMGISRQSLASLLRRGTKNVLGTTVVR